jgi:hypothetical protein
MCVSAEGPRRICDDESACPPVEAVMGDVVWSAVLGVLCTSRNRNEKAMDCKEYAWILSGDRKGYVKETSSTAVMEGVTPPRSQKIVVSVEQECPFSRRVGKSDMKDFAGTGRMKLGLMEVMTPLASSLSSS